RPSRPALRVISVTPCRTDATWIAGGGAAIVNENGWTYPKVIFVPHFICPEIKLGRRQSVPRSGKGWGRGPEPGDAASLSFQPPCAREVGRLPKTERGARNTAPAEGGPSLVTPGRGS